MRRLYSQGSPLQMPLHSCAKLRIIQIKQWLLLTALSSAQEWNSTRVEQHLSKPLPGLMFYSDFVECYSTLNFKHTKTRQCVEYHLDFMDGMQLESGIIKIRWYTIPA